MEKKIKLILLIGLIVSLLSPFLLAQESDDPIISLHIFYGQGCPHCGAALNFLNSAEEKYPTLIVKEHEIYFNQEERKLFEQVIDAFGEKIEGVPTIFIDNKVIVGFSHYLNHLNKKFKDV